MPEVQHEGASVHYEVDGEGPPLLLIAGIASDASSWAPLVPLLAPHFTLIMPDNRAAGRTRHAGVLNIGDIGGDCLAVLDALGIEKTAIAGHSLGGMIGLRMASTWPARVTRLATLCSANRIGDKERVLFKDLARLYARIEPQLWFRLLFQWLFSSPVTFEEGALAGMADAAARYPYRQSARDFAVQVEAIDRMRPAVLPAIKCPVLAIAAEKDLLMLPRAVTDGHRGVPDLRTALIANAGHSVHWEAPEAVATELLRFLRG